MEPSLREQLAELVWQAFGVDPLPRQLTENSSDELKAFLDEFRADSLLPVGEWFAELQGPRELTRKIIDALDDAQLARLFAKLERARPQLAPQLAALRRRAPELAKRVLELGHSAPDVEREPWQSQRKSAITGTFQNQRPPSAPSSTTTPQPGTTTRSTGTEQPEHEAAGAHVGGASPGSPSGQPEAREIERPNPSPAPPSPRPAVPPQRVSLGFASPEDPAAPLAGDRSLATSSLHLFWVEVGADLATGSLLPPPAPLAELREGDVLDVILFPFPEQLTLEGTRHGRLQLGRTGARVDKPAHGIRGASPTRLFFLVRTPDSAGRFALRCNLYCRGVLLQSHLVRAEVTAAPERRPDACSRVLDYNLSASLAAAHLGADDDCRASLFLNDDGRGTHSFRFVSSTAGQPEHIGDAHIEGAQLTRMVMHAREALRWAAWGSEKPWDKDLPCKFSGAPDDAHLRDSLILLAKRGANLWMELAAQFGFAGPAARQLREHLRNPGRVQIALKHSPNAVFPAALIYDYPLDIALSDLSLCPAYLAALGARRPLAGEPCFLGQCPSYAAKHVVCPSGFWGFRHDLGLPLHLPGGEVATTISRGDGVRAFAPISTDPKLVQRDEHLRALAAISPELPAGWLEILNDREACLARLVEPRQLVYFYCHGGVSTKDEVPYLQVGDTTSDVIYAQSLFAAEISWPEPVRPLVILNGCHTTATSPEAMFSMLTAFASHCNAAGVIGTEITNFEFIAAPFAQELLRQFFDGEKLGRAVRLARLKLLGGGNPLGLMYLPFALPSLHLD